MPVLNQAPLILAAPVVCEIHGSCASTHGFASVSLGGRSFFSLGRAKHLELCKRPVFLDFGFHMVEVEQFTDTITMVSGFGVVRTREWFVNTFLSAVRQPESRTDAPFVPERDRSTPWDTKSPAWKLKHDTQWIDPNTGRVVTRPKWTEYIKLDYMHWTRGDSQNKWYDYDLVIDRHPDIANGWTKDGLRQMMDFLGGTAAILGGLLRVLPSPATNIPAPPSVSSAKHLLAIAEGHILAGRLPVLRQTTKSGLIEKAREHAMRFYSDAGSHEQRQNQISNVQRSLFD